MLIEDGLKEAARRASTVKRGTVMLCFYVERSPSWRCDIYAGPNYGAGDGESPEEALEQSIADYDGNGT